MLSLAQTRCNLGDGDDPCGSYPLHAANFYRVFSERFRRSSGLQTVLSRFRRTTPFIRSLRETFKRPSNCDTSSSFLSGLSQRSLDWRISASFRTLAVSLTFLTLTMTLLAGASMISATLTRVSIPNGST